VRRPGSLGIGLFAIAATVFAAYSGRIDHTTWRVVVGVLTVLAVIDECAARRWFAAGGWVVMVVGVLAGNAISHPWGSVVGGGVAYLIVTPAANRADELY
jgi:hypothetical protein